MNCYCAASFRRLPNSQRMAVPAARVGQVVPGEWPRGQPDSAPSATRLPMSRVVTAEWGDGRILPRKRQRASMERAVHIYPGRARGVRGHSGLCAHSQMPRAERPASVR